jgi:hypothetical protein
MKYLLFIGLFALCSCNKNEPYEWVCTSDSVYVDGYGEQHATTTRWEHNKTRDEIKLVEEAHSHTSTDSISDFKYVQTTCKK